MKRTNAQINKLEPAAKKKNSMGALWFKTPWKSNKIIPLFHELRSEWGSERTSEWAQRSAQAKRAVRSVANEWAVRANERADERMAKYSLALISYHAYPMWIVATTGGALLWIRVWWSFWGKKMMGQKSRGDRFLLWHNSWIAVK